MTLVIEKKINCDKKVIKHFVLFSKTAPPTFFKSYYVVITFFETLVNSLAAAWWHWAGDRGAVPRHWSQPRGLDPGISVLMNTCPHVLLPWSWILPWSSQAPCPPDHQPCSMNMTRISSLVLTAPRFVFWRLEGIVRGVLRVKWLSIKQWFVSGDMISDWAVHTPFITPWSLSKDWQSLPSERGESWSSGEGSHAL